MSLSPPSSDSPPPRARVALVWVVVIVVVVAGLAVVGVAAYYASRPASPASTVNATLPVTDDLGRHVVVPVDPARVVVLGPSIMDSMYRLGLRGHVVGVDCYAPSLGGLSEDYSPDQVSLWNLSSSMCVQIGPTFAIEDLLALAPELVLAATIVSVAAVEQISVTYGIPVVMLQPATVTGVILDDQLLGEIFEVPGAAAKLSATLEVTIDAAAEFQANLTDNGTLFPTVLLTYDTDSNGYWTFGPGTFGESLIELASGSSISANATLPYPELSGEQVLASDPQVLVYGTGFGLNESSYSTAPFWAQLTAVEDGQTYPMDSNYFTEADPTMILAGLPALFAILHPGNTI